MPRGDSICNNGGGGLFNKSNVKDRGLVTQKNPTGIARVYHNELKNESFTLQATLETDAKARHGVQALPT